MPLVGTCVATWGHDVVSQHSVAVAAHNVRLGDEAMSSSSSFAYVSGGNRVVLSEFVGAGPGGLHHPQHPSPAPIQRVFNLPPRVEVTCVALFGGGGRPLMAVGSHDHGAFVVPTVTSDKGGLSLGDHVCSAADCQPSSLLFSSVEAQYLSASTGKHVVSLAFLPPSVASASVLVVASMRKGGPRVAAEDPSSAAAVPILSLWALDGPQARSLLWCSAALPSPIHSITTCWQSGSIVVCTKRDVSVWRLAAASGSGATGGRAPGLSSSLLDVKQRQCQSIPELRGSDFVAVAVPNDVVRQRSDAEADGGADTSGVIYALTTAGFLVCYRRDGSILKWMDCKVCPATTMVCTATHVIVGGTTIRLFSLHTWEFCGKVALGGGDAAGASGSSGVLSAVDAVNASSGYLAALFRHICVAVAATPHSLCVFYGNFDAAHFCLSTAAHGPKKYKIAFTTTLSVGSIAPTTAEGTWTTGAKFLRYSLSDAAAAVAQRSDTMPSLGMIGTRRLVLWSPLFLRSFDALTLQPTSARVDVETTCAVMVPQSDAVVAFDARVGAFVAFDVSASLAHRCSAPFDSAVDALYLVPASQRAVEPNQDVAVSYLIGVSSGGVDGVAAGYVTMHRLQLQVRRSDDGHLSMTIVVERSSRVVVPPLPESLRDGVFLAQDDGVLRSPAPMLAFTDDGYYGIYRRHLWSFRGSDVSIVLPIDATHVCATAERLILTRDGSDEIVVVDPKSERLFTFKVPSTICGDVWVDCEVKFLVCRSCRGSGDDGDGPFVLVLNLRDKCSELDRVATASASGQRGVVGHSAVAAVALREGAGSKAPAVVILESRKVIGAAGASCAVGAVSLFRVAVDGKKAGQVGKGTFGPSGTAARRAVAVASPRVASISPISAVSSAHKGAADVPPAARGRQKHVDPAAKHERHVDPNGHQKRRTLSCGAVPGTAELERRFSELKGLAAGAAKATASSGTAHAPESSGSAAVQPRDALRVGDRRNDPFRQSGLLLTPQVHESRHGDVMLRLGLRWGGAGVGAQNMELPTIRSQDSVLSAADTSGIGDALLTDAGKVRHVVEPAQATELLLRRMARRDDVPPAGTQALGGGSVAAAQHPLSVSEQQGSSATVPTIEGIVTSSVALTDSVAAELLTKERERVQLGVGSAGPQADGGPTVWRGGSPHRHGEPVVAFPTGCYNVAGPGDQERAEDAVRIGTSPEDADFVVMASSSFSEDRRQLYRSRQDTDGFGEDDASIAAAPPPRAMFASALASRSDLPVQIPSIPIPSCQKALSTATTLRPSDERRTQSGMATARPFEERLRTVSRDVRASLASLREMLALAAVVRDDAPDEASECDVAAELSAVLVELAATVQQTAATCRSRPTSSTGATAIAVRLRGETSDEAQRQGPVSAPSFPDVSTTVSEASLQSTVSAAQFHMLLQELQTVRRQNLDILELVARDKR